MNTKKLQRLKILVSVLIAANTLMCFYTEVQVMYNAYTKDWISVVYGAAMILNAVAAELLIVLHDAIIAELEERKARKQKVRKRSVSGGEVFPAKNLLYDISAYEAMRSRTEAD